MTKLIEIIGTIALIGATALAILIAAILALIELTQGGQRKDRFAESIDASFRGKH